MLLRFVRGSRLIAGIPFIQGNNPYDNIQGLEPDSVFHTEEDNVTGWQRLRNLFRKHHDDPIHPAVTEFMQNSMAGFIFGGFYGAITQSRYAFIKFIENNEATQFQSHLDAKRKLSDEMFKSYLKGFGKWGWKVGCFVTVFTGTQLALSVYHNKYAFWHYSAGAATAGALYKFSLGPKGMISGAIFGCLFGTAYGTFKVALLQLTNRTEEDLMKFRHNLQEMKVAYGFNKEKANQSEIIQEKFKKQMENVTAQDVEE